MCVCIITLYLFVCLTVLDGLFLHLAIIRSNRIKLFKNHSMANLSLLLVVMLTLTFVNTTLTLSLSLSISISISL